MLRTNFVSTAWTRVWHLFTYLKQWFPGENFILQKNKVTVKLPYYKNKQNESTKVRVVSFNIGLHLLHQFLNRLTLRVNSDPWSKLFTSFEKKSLIFKLKHINLYTPYTQFILIERADTLLFLNIKHLQTCAAISFL